MITVKNRFTGRVILEVETLRWVDLHGVDLRWADLHEVDLHGAYLPEVDLHGVDLHGADLRWAYLYRADLRGADLRGANLRGANLFGADLFGANLRGADLRGADLFGADLNEADLNEANLFGAEVKKNPIQISGLRWDVMITDKHMKIGCKVFLHTQWLSFNDDQISDMDVNALIFWSEHKTSLLAFCAELSK